MKLYRLTLFLLLITAVMAGCKKYDIAPLVKDPSYMRVFNNLNNTVNALNNQQAAPFLTFLMDPKMDASGTPGDGSIIGDYLGTRQVFSLSYPINEANSSSGNGTLGTLGYPGKINLTPVNYEYPGNAHVQSAPVINGLDLSAWAQVPSGKHRMMFIIRPQNSIGFKDLAQVTRGNILVDTTINFEKGEVYTLEVVSRDLDKNKYGLYVRKEQFIHQAFDVNKLYVGFVNLSGVTPANGKAGFGFYFGDKVRISSSYAICNDAVDQHSVTSPPSYYALAGYNNTLLTTLATKMDPSVDYHAFPMLPTSYFFYQGLLRTYPDLNNSYTGAGTLPNLGFTIVDAGKPAIDGDQNEGFGISCAANPSTFNSYNVKPGLTPNLNLIVNTGQSYHIYSTLNVMELVYNRVYLMQIQRGFDEVPEN